MTLDELEKLCKEALPAPWKWEFDDLEQSTKERGEPWRDADIISGGDSEDFCEVVIRRDSGHYLSHLPSAEFIIAARTYMPRLIEIAKAAEEQLGICEPYIDGTNPQDDLRKKLEELEE